MIKLPAPRPLARAASVLLALGFVAAAACGGDGPSEPPVPDLAISTAALPDAAEGETYSANVQATGGSGGYTWSLESGSLPQGLALQVAAGDASVTGTPTQDGTFEFRLLVRSGDGQEARRTFTIEVEPAPDPLSVTTASLPGGTVGEAYAATVAATGGEGGYSWSVAGGGLPDGLTLSSDGGSASIGGTPTEEGSFEFTLGVESGDGQSAERTFSIVVEPAPDPLSVTTTSLPGATVGEAYTATVAAVGGEGGYSWSIAAGGLPDGLTLSSDGGSGSIGGTPTAAGSFEFTLRVESGDGQSAERTFTIVVESSIQPLVITTTSLPDATVGEPYTASVDAEGGEGDYAWQLISGAPPPGLVLNVEDLPENDVIITGTPDTAGGYTFALRVTSGDGQQAEVELTLTVVEPSAGIVIERPYLPHGIVGAPYAALLRATGGSGSYIWQVSAGSLPPGLALAGDSIYGTTSTVGSWTFTVRAESEGAQAGERSYTIEVKSFDGANYNITPFYVVDVPAGIEPHLLDAIARWEAVVTADLQEIWYPSDALGPDACAGFPDAVNGAVVDDLLLIVNVGPIDGPGATLAQAGPCSLRPSNGLPIVGVVTFDSDDLGPLVGSETLTGMIAHELGHVLGVGVLWEGFLDGEGTADPRYTGPLANTEWHALGGEGTVPVESEGGEGTADSHWRETIFGQELMTGFIEALDVPMPLSRVSIAAVEDLGYDVDYNEADDFSLGSPSGIAGLVERERGSIGYDRILEGPRHMADGQDGRTFDLR